MVLLVVPVDHTLHVDAEIIGLYQCFSPVCQQFIAPPADYVRDVGLKLFPIGYVLIFIGHEYRPSSVALVIALEYLSPANAPLSRCFDVVLALALFDHTAVVPATRSRCVAPIILEIMQVTAMVSATVSSLVGDVRPRGAVVPFTTSCVTVIVAFTFVQCAVVYAYLSVSRGPVGHKLGLEDVVVAPAALF